ncbi:MAG: hypothetical protein KA109_09535 [Saprospiraceae bacterium]|jgi:hypothetical protein|nr:hypothetical protein [Saprospiraceae bacterium]MBK6817682.1 hypothetical protein [Saprospiraceae bacterium]MBK7373056.1 hypothetical protein [Saprospiraceae bacterium]MBK7439820.1 hypothetical protein [Saprospiraceae bacterium]MBK7608978.1 hypothetical protein [Saprospiraceae bacterium]
MGSQYFKYILGGLSIVLVYAACRSVECPPNKTELLNKFNQFVNATMQTKQFYSIKEWESKDQVFSGYLQNCYPKYDSLYYLDERQKFWTDALRYYFKRYDNRVTVELLNNKNPNSQIMQNQIKSTWANPDQAFTQIFQEMTGLKFDDAMQAVRDSTLKSEK